MDMTHPSSLPLLGLGDDLPAGVGVGDFDYGVFLEEEDMEYMAEDSGSTSAATTATMTDGRHHHHQQQYYADENSPTTEPSSSSLVIVRSSTGGSSSGSAAAAAADAAAAAAGRQRLERRGHTKSRRGCFNCKRRRIKCQETRPACGHCVKTGLRCEYPALPATLQQPSNQVPLFSLQDMRFFQYFLLKCYPHHPLGNEGIWTHEVPCLSQTHEYLMHAILGLAASDLLRVEPSLVTAAMTHRIKAIRAIKRALADVPQRGGGCGDRNSGFFEDGNALMATCFALTFQSVLLDDGMGEYMTFIRGIVIVATHMYMRGARFLFSNFLGEDQHALMRPFLEALPLIRSDWVDAAVSSVSALEPLCRAHPIDREYHRLILDIARNLYVSSYDAYVSLSKHYGWWMLLQHDQFQRLVDLQSNPLSVLLATHWIALKQIMVIITETEYAIRDQNTNPHHGPNPPPAEPSFRADALSLATTPGAEPQHRRTSENRGEMEQGLLRWLRHLNRLLEPHLRPFNAWPEWVEAQLERDAAFFGKTR